MGVGTCAAHTDFMWNAAKRASARVSEAVLVNFDLPFESLLHLSPSISSLSFSAHDLRTPGPSQPSSPVHPSLPVSAPNLLFLKPRSDYL